MASPGRPVERPAHLSQEQRTRARAKTLQWRQKCGLSQRDMATQIGVSYASYWPRQQDMSYDRVVELLRLAGFDVPLLKANRRLPAGVFWVHRRERPIWCTAS